MASTDTPDAAQTRLAMQAWQLRQLVGGPSAATPVTRDAPARLQD